MDPKTIHERIRSLYEIIDTETHEMRGKIKNYTVIAKYSWNENNEVEEVYVSSPDTYISIIINPKGGSSVTFVKDGKMESRTVNNEEELEKIINEVLQQLS